MNGFFVHCSYFLLILATTCSTSWPHTQISRDRAAALRAITTTVQAKILPAEIKAILDAHTKELQHFLHACTKKPNARMGHNVREMSWLPGYFIKYGIERFYNAQRLKRVIEDYNLDLISVPTKYLYHVPGRPTARSSKNYIVISKKVANTPSRPPLNLDQIKQLCTVALRTPHYDLHAANYVITPQGTLVILDTDKGGMPSLRKIQELEKDRLVHGTRIHGKNGKIVKNPNIVNDPLTKLEIEIYSNFNQHYDAQATQYLKEQLKKRESEFRRKKKEFLGRF